MVNKRNFFKPLTFGEKGLLDEYTAQVPEQVAEGARYFSVEGNILFSKSSKFS